MLASVGLVISAIVILGVLIVVHEFGHFIVAKWCGVGVIEFSIGFGRQLWRRRFGETHYTLRLIPLGGYVRMCGDNPFEQASQEKAPAEQVKGVDEAKLTGSDDTSWYDEKDRALLADRARWFLSKNFSRKAAIVLAGPLFNLIFAVILATFVNYAYGQVIFDLAPRIGDLIPGYPAEKSGLEPGDLVKSVNGKPMRSWPQLAKTVRFAQGGAVDLEVERKQANAAPKTLHVTVSGIPDTDEMKLLTDASGADGVDKRSYKIGITPNTLREPVGLVDAVLDGGYQVWGICTLTGRLLKAVFIGSISARKVVGGPIAVFAGAAKSAKRGLEHVLDFMVMLSVSLALFNLFPVPILDGGHLLFFVIEKIRGAPLSLRVQAIANQVGLVLLGLLMAFAVSNDIIRLL